MFYCQNNVRKICRSLESCAKIFVDNREKKIENIFAIFVISDNPFFITWDDILKTKIILWNKYDHFSRFRLINFSGLTKMFLNGINARRILVCGKLLN